MTALSLVLTFGLFVAFISIYLYSQSVKRKRAIELAVRSATFPVGEQLVDVMGRNAFVVDNALEKLLLIEVKNGGAVVKRQWAAQDIAAARVLEGTRVIAMSERGSRPVLYPSAHEIAEFIERVSDKVFSQAHPEWSTDNRKNAQLFYRIVTQIYLREKMGMAQPTEADIDRMLPYIQSVSRPLGLVRVQVDVYADQRRTLTETHSVNLVAVSGWSAQKGHAAGTPIERAKTWQRLMVDAIERSEVPTSIPFELQERTPVTVERDAYAPVVAMTPRASDSDSLAATDEHTSLRDTDSLPEDVLAEAVAESTQDGYVTEPIERSPPASTLERDTVHDAHERDLDELLLPNVHQQTTSPVKEDPYKALLESLRAPLSSDNEPTQKADEFASEWERQRAKARSLDSET